MDPLAAAATAAALFAATDVDDLAVLTVFFAAARTTGRPRAWQVWAGQYAGIGVLVGVSLLAALGLSAAPDAWLRLLGLLPLGLGLHGLWRAARGEDGDDLVPTGGGALTVAGVTIANGADNVAVYVPVFAHAEPAALAVMVAVFAAAVAVWCLAAGWLGTHRLTLAALDRWGRWLVPCVFLTLGLWILLG